MVEKNVANSAENPGKMSHRLIDADALEQCFLGICDMCEGKDSNMCRACAADDMKELLEDAPTIDAVPVVHGEWVQQYENEPSFDGRTVVRRHYVICSNCRSWYSPNVRMKFCPNCGAKMDLEDKDE